MEFIKITLKEAPLLRSLISLSKEASVLPLGILADHPLDKPDSGLEAFGLMGEEDGKPILEAAALVGGKGGLVLPFARSPSDAEELGTHLKDSFQIRSLSAPRRIGESFLRGAGALDKVLLVRPLTVYGASPDFLGPFVCPELRKASIADLPRLVPFAAQAVKEQLGEDPSAIDAEGFERRVAARVLAGRTFILEKGRDIILKVDIATMCGAGAEIDGVYIRPELRRRGIASLALGQLTRHMLGRMPRLSVRVPDGDEAAKRLCLKVGYMASLRRDEHRLMVLR